MLYANLETNIDYLSLCEDDNELGDLITNEYTRQNKSINLVASENYANSKVLFCLGSALTNKYSEGQPGKRYYGGNQYIDKIELLCKNRCLQAFNLDQNIWSVNVQPYSGSPANLAAITAFLKPHERIMGLNLADGGHLTHGYYTPTKKLSFSSLFYESFPYFVDKETELIDYDGLLRDAIKYQPQLIICGASAYPRMIDFKRFREIVDSLPNKCLLMADIAHIAGLVAAKLHVSPFDYCDIVTTTVHKTLGGPRGALIFVNKERLGSEAETKVNEAVFPTLQGGPHNNNIAAIACQMKLVMSPSWIIYAKQIIDNAHKIAKVLTENGAKLVTNGTDNHLLLWNLKPYGITGSKLEKVAELCSININKNTIPGDTSALSPSGVRIGTAAMTTRGCQVHHMEKIAFFLLKCVQIAIDIQKVSGKSLNLFISSLNDNYNNDIQILKKQVEEFLDTL